jgi:hypothetical protein
LTARPWRSGNSSPPVIWNLVVDLAANRVGKRTIADNSGREIWFSIKCDFASIWQFRHLARQIPVTDMGKLQICFVAADPRTILYVPLHRLRGRAC